MAAIIFPTDFSAVSVSALPWALKMADTLDATIHCLYIVEEPQIYSTLDMGAVAIPTTGELVTGAETRMQLFVLLITTEILMRCSEISIKLL